MLQSLIAIAFLASYIFSLTLVLVVGIIRV